MDATPDATDADRTSESSSGSVSTDFAWKPPITIWGPDSLRNEPTGNAQPKSRKPWGIRHIFIGLGIAIGLNVIISVAAMGLLIYRANITGASANDLNDQLASLTSDPVFLIINLLTLWMGLLAGPLLASYRNGAHSLAQDFWFRFNWKRDIAIGIGLALALRVADLGLGYLIQLAGVSPEDMSNSNFLVGQSAVALVFLGLAASVGAPIVEELFFRGLALQAFMKRWGPAAGVILSSVLFGMMHTTVGANGQFGIGSMYIIAVTGLLGAVLAITVLRSKRLGPAVVAHIVFNLSGVLLTIFSF